MPSEIPALLSTEGVIATHEAVRAVIAAADAFSRAGQWAKANEIYDRAIELASGVEDHDGVRMAAAHAVEVSWRHGVPGLEHARQVAEWLFTIDDAATHDAGEQLLAAVADRASADGDVNVLRKCLDAAYRADSVARVGGRAMSRQWPETVRLLEVRIQSLRTTPADPSGCGAAGRAAQNNR